MSEIIVEDVLKKTYNCVAELWCSPQDVDMEKVRNEADEVVTSKILHRDVGALLAKFLEKNIVAEEEYIEMFELDPRCPLYLGSYSFDEPSTCANAAVSDRNEYMIEIGAIYKHFGFELNGKELSDYLPLMIEFLSLTVNKRNDSVRKKFIEEYMLPFLPPMGSKLKELKSQYLFLLDTVESLIKLDLDKGKKEDLRHV